jgi:hypothetical protein
LPNFPQKTTPDQKTGTNISGFGGVSLAQIAGGTYFFVNGEKKYFDYVRGEDRRGVPSAC